MTIHCWVLAAPTLSQRGQLACARGMEVGPLGQGPGLILSQKCAETLDQRKPGCDQKSVWV